MKSLGRGIGIVCIAFVFLYCLMLFSVRDVLSDAKRALDGKVGANESIGALTRYLPSAFPENESATKSTLIPLFAVHNFHSGQIMVLYWQETVDKTTGETLQESSGIPSSWRIEKIEGKWSVVEITEDP